MYMKRVHLKPRGVISKHGSSESRTGGIFHLGHRKKVDPSTERIVVDSHCLNFERVISQRESSSKKKLQQQQQRRVAPPMTVGRSGACATAVAVVTNFTSHKLKFRVRHIPNPIGTGMSAADAVPSAGQSHLERTAASRLAPKFVFEPEVGTIKRGKSVSIKITLKTMVSGATVRELLVIDAVDGDSTVRVPLLADLEFRPPLFGVALTDLPSHAWYPPESVKSILSPTDPGGKRDKRPAARSARTRDNALCTRSCGGLSADKIFRMPASDDLVDLAMHSVQSGTFEEEKVGDPHICANLIKLWIRSLPAPLLDSVPHDALLECSVLQDCSTVIRALDSSERGVLLFIVDLLSATAHRCTQNSMSPKALATIFGPNIFDISGRGSAAIDPMNAVKLSQKSVIFLEMAIAGAADGLKTEPQ